MTVRTTVRFPRDVNFGAKGVQGGEDVEYAEQLCQGEQFLAQDSDE